MAKRIKIGNAVLCEHVVKGENNKHVLINTYGGDVIVSQMPAQLTFGVYLEIWPNEPGQMKLAFEIVKNRKSLFKSEVEFPDVDPKRPSIIAVPLINMQIEKDLTFKIVVSGEGYNRTTAISKRIYQGQPVGNN